ncbi:hypothetical protein AURDEDRAFT_166165 [Auricularia subglabra TFB-10046 SS5]|nr:hypothetical protein AURDEDRAFT_166165 [Auricularia subglabra TFB-10046 SS5]
MPYLDRMTAFTLSISYFPAFIDAELDFPALTSFTLELNPQRDGRVGGGIYRHPGDGRAAVPLLQTFTFAARRGTAFGHASLEWFFAELPKYFRQWFIYDAHVLPRLCLSGIIPGMWLERYPAVVKPSLIYSLALEFCICPAAV